MTTVIYDVVEQYWKREGHVVAVTDDLQYARSFVLERLRYYGITWTNEKLREFDEQFERVRSDPDLSLHFSERDCHFTIRRSQVRVAIGGLSTIGDV